MAVQGPKMGPLTFIELLAALLARWAAGPHNNQSINRSEGTQPDP